MLITTSRPQFTAAAADRHLLGAPALWPPAPSDASMHPTCGGGACCPSLCRPAQGPPGLQTQVTCAGGAERNVLAEEGPTAHRRHGGGGILRGPQHHALRTRWATPPAQRHRRPLCVAACLRSTPGGDPCIRQRHCPISVAPAAASLANPRRASRGTTAAGCPRAGMGEEPEHGHWLSHSEEGSQGRLLALHRCAWQQPRPLPVTLHRAASQGQPHTVVSTPAWFCKTDGLRRRGCSLVLAFLLLDTTACTPPAAASLRLSLLSKGVCPEKVCTLMTAPGAAEPCCRAPPACRAAYCGDVEELRRLLPGLSLRQKLQLDPQGNTVRPALPGSAGGRANLDVLQERGCGLARSAAQGGSCIAGRSAVCRLDWRACMGRTQAAGR